MSDSKTSTDNVATGSEQADDAVGKPVDDAADAAVDTIEDSSGEPRQDAAQPRRARPGRAIGWLTLLLAVTALAAAGYVVRNSGNSGEASAANQAALAALAGTLDSTRSAVDDSRTAIDALRRRMDALANAEAARGRDLAALQRQLEDRLQPLVSLSGRVANLESSLASLQGISSGVRDTWLLREAEYYMQIANAQLQLAGNPELALLALQQADERLLKLADPALTGVRRALSDELRALETMHKPDLEGIALTLASLASVVDSLPMRQELAHDEAVGEDVDPELSGMDRALASLRKTLGEMVSVRRTDAAAQPLMAPEAQFFLRANLSLQLQAARLALLQGEQAIFEQSLDDASRWLHRYYDSDSAPVQSALLTIAEIRTGSFAVSPPDISASLRLLRQFETLSSAADEAGRAPAAEPQ